MSLSVYIPFKDPNVAVLQRVISAVLSQTHVPRELLLIDDGSTKPEVHELITTLHTQPSVRVVRHPKNLGVAAARNTALRNCSSELVCSFDADIVPDPDCIEHLVLALRADTSLGGVGGRVREFFDDTPGDRFRGFFTKQDRGDAPLPNVDLFGGCTLFLTAAVRQIRGFFSPLRNSFEDFDLSQRMRKAGFNTLYTPYAKGWHHKRDSVGSALDTLWRWSYPHWEGDSWIFAYDWLNDPEQQEPPEFYYEELVSESFARLLYKISSEMPTNLGRINSAGITDELRFLARVFLVRSILNDVRTFSRLNRSYDTMTKTTFVRVLEQALIAVLSSERCVSFGREALSLVGDRFCTEGILAEEPLALGELQRVFTSCGLPEEALAVVEEVVVGVSQGVVAPGGSLT